jgi:hypothetical protein
VEIPIGRPEEEEKEEPSVEHMFAKCLGGLVSVVMHEVQVELAFPAREIEVVYSCGLGQ